MINAINLLCILMTNNLVPADFFLMYYLFIIIYINSIDISFNYTIIYFSHLL